MAQPEYIVREGKHLAQRGLAGTEWPDKGKQTGSIDLGGLGVAPVISRSGEYHADRIRLRLILPSGDEMRGSVFTVKTRQRAVDATIRRLSPTDAADLDQYDRQIARLRAERAQLLASAWERAYRVPLAELTEHAELGGVG